MNHPGSGAGGGEPGLIFFGGYDPLYPRNSIIRKGWSKSGYYAGECRVDLRLKSPLRYPALIWRYLRSGLGSGAIFVPDFRHKDVPLAWMLSRLGGRKLIFDPLVSRYETRVLDREDAAHGSAQARHNMNIDRVSFTLPDLVLSDTEAHARFYARIFNISENRMCTLHLGFDEDLFSEIPPRSSSAALEVLFYGTYLPLHGVETIVDAARILRGEQVRFVLVGSGQTYDDIVRRAAGIDGIEFRDSIPASELNALIGRADVVLGIFGRTEKAGNVIPNKIYQALAVGRPVVTRDSSAIRELFIDGRHLLTVPPADAEALAAAIRRLVNETGLRDRLAAEGGALVRNEYNSKRVAQRLARILRERGISEGAAGK
jgi:glycosyltransferase involved in cell wall biosynthesis